ncbi:hypothetical protein [Flavobacterium aquatile]|nr:hypothetical protein [Flavobacterium aquatile]
MNIEELANKEIQLYDKVCSLNGTIEEKQNQIIALGISNEYNLIFQKYAELCVENIEALKRGLFISWFSFSEPTFLTGINELDKNAEENIVKEINVRIKNNSLDSELNWMIDYYKDWDYIFKEYYNYEHFKTKIMNKEETKLPKIEKQKMENRGQMGIYWSSLNQ